MRVSKTVKDYIENQVARRVCKSQQELEYDAIQEKVEKANQEIRKKLEIAKQSIMAEVTKDFDITPEIAKQKYDYFDTWGCDWKSKQQEERRERERKISKTITDIIVTLELGGTKADLEKMLAEIK